jgi:hypothetical protein
MDKCASVVKAHSCLINLISEDCLINRHYVTAFNNLDLKIKEYYCETTYNTNIFLNYFKTNYLSDDLNRTDNIFNKNFKKYAQSMVQSENKVNITSANFDMKPRCLIVDNSTNATCHIRLDFYKCSVYKFKSSDFYVMDENVVAQKVYKNLLNQLDEMVLVNNSLIDLKIKVKTNLDFKLILKVKKYKCIQLEKNFIVYKDNEDVYTQDDLHRNDLILSNQANGKGINKILIGYIPYKFSALIYVDHFKNKFYINSEYPDVSKPTVKKKTFTYKGTTNSSVCDVFQGYKPNQTYLYYNRLRKLEYCSLSQFKNISKTNLDNLYCKFENILNVIDKVKRKFKDFRQDRLKPILINKEYLKNNTDDYKKDVIYQDSYFELLSFSLNNNSTRKNMNDYDVLNSKSNRLNCELKNYFAKYIIFSYFLNFVNFL